MPRKSKKPAKKAIKQCSTPRLLLSGDAAANAAVSLFLDGRLIAHSPADGTTFRNLWQIVKPMLAPYTNIASYDRVAVIEDGFRPKMGGKSALTLARRRGLMQAAFEAAGFERFEFIGASTWQSYIFGGHRVDDTKASSIAYVEQRYGFTPVTDDVADSISMASYFLDVYCLQ